MSETDDTIINYASNIAWNWRGMICTSLLWETINYYRQIYLIVIYCYYMPLKHLIV